MAHVLAKLTARAAVTESTRTALESIPDATPVPVGHAFELYCPVWNDSSDYQPSPDGKTKALDAIARCQLDPELGDAVNARTAATALGQNQSTTLSLPLISTSALITGSGIEHPTDNGYSLLKPYGMPYLAGSGIKGTLRAAAENQALFNPEGEWTMADVWWLFGWESQVDYWKPAKNVKDEDNRTLAFQRWLNSKSPALDGAMTLLQVMAGSDSDHSTEKLNDLRNGNLNPESYAFRGLLDFWDMLLPKATSTVDIMTPHYSGYYQGKGAPDETESPVPISFLAIAAGARGRMTLQWRGDRPGLAALEPVKQLQVSWRSKLSTLIEDTILWEGFGAKTAVGYGRFTIDSDTQHQDETRLVEAKQAIEQQKQQQRAAELQSSMGEEQYAIFDLRERFLAGELSGTEEINNLIRKATGIWEVKDRRALAELAREIYAANKVSNKRKKIRVALLQALLPEKDS